MNGAKQVEFKNDMHGQMEKSKIIYLIDRNFLIIRAQKMKELKMLFNFVFKNHKRKQNSFGKIQNCNCERHTSKTRQRTERGDIGRS